jgi:hypothetical protein
MSISVLEIFFNFKLLFPIPWPYVIPTILPKTHIEYYKVLQRCLAIRNQMLFEPLQCKIFNDTLLMHTHPVIRHINFSSLYLITSLTMSVYNWFHDWGTCVICYVQFHILVITLERKGLEKNCLKIGKHTLFFCQVTAHLLVYLFLLF